MKSITDDDLVAMLEERADRASIEPAALVADWRLALASVVAASRAHRSRRIVGGLAGLAAVIAVIVVVAVPLGSVPVASLAPTASASPPASTAPSTAAPVPGTVTAAQLDAVIARPESVGLTVAFAGELDVDPSAFCEFGSTCRLKIAGATTLHSIEPSTQLPPPTASGRYVGIFGLRVTGRTEYRGSKPVVVIELLGAITPIGQGLAWPVATLAGRVDQPADLVVTSGWIIRTPIHPCPSVVGQACHLSEDLLTADPYDPVQPDGSVIGGPAGSSIDLAYGAYDTWAPRRGADVPVEPQHVTLLLRWIPGTSCPSPSSSNAIYDCYPPAFGSWEVVGRLDPVGGASP